MALVSSGRLALITYDEDDDDDDEDEEEESTDAHSQSDSNLGALWKAFLPCHSFRRDGSVQYTHGRRCIAQRKGFN